MNLPSHLFLPLAGAVVLAAAVMGTWLWPEPVVPPLKLEPPPVATPVFVQPQPPPPAPTPRPVRPVARAVPPAPAVQPLQPVEPPRPATVAPPPEPVPWAAAPAFPPPPQSEPAASPPPVPGKRLAMMGNAASVLERGVLTLEKSRDEALARGDKAESERLNKLIEKHRSRLAYLRARQPQPQAPDSGEPPKR